MPNFNISLYKTIHYFNSLYEGVNPAFNSVVEPISGKLYGNVADDGIIGRYGSIYKCDLDGQNLLVLYKFSGESAGSSLLWGLIDGSQPNSNLLIASDGNLYGTTIHGGFNVPDYGSTPNIFGAPFSGFGTIFKYDIVNNTLTYLHRFSGYSYQDGADPTGSPLIEVNGIFYGTTLGGGYSSGTPPSVVGFGTIYSCDTNGNYGVIHRFQNNILGYATYNIIYGNDGFLYGINSQGGNVPGGLGTLFKSDLNGNVTLIHRFSGQTYGDGLDPRNIMLASNGIIYGTTINGGLNNLGTIYSCDTLGNYGVIHSFNSLTGSLPSAPITEYFNNGIFYGVTGSGGSNNKGVIYSCDTLGNYGVIHNFGDLSTLGFFPGSKLFLSNTNGSYYGTTSGGNTIYTWISPCVFPYTPSGKTYVELFDPKYTTYHYTWSNTPSLPFGPGNITYNFPFATKDNSYYWGNQCLSTFVDYRIYEYSSQLDQNKEILPTFSRSISLPALSGNPLRGYKGIADYGGFLMLVANAVDQRVDILDISTNTGTLFLIYFNLPSPYQFDLTNRLTDSLYYDFNTGILYIAFANVFASFDSAGSVLNSGSPPSGNVVSMYIYDGNIYTNTDNNLIYLTTPGPSQSWIFNSLGSGPNNGPMYGIAQSDPTCINTAFQPYTPPPPPPPCVISAYTVTGCSEFVITSFSGENITCLHDGSIHIATSGGCANYTFELLDNSYQTVSTHIGSTTYWDFTGITTPGIYYASVTDCSGITISTISTITLLDLRLYSNIFKLNNLEYCVTLSGGTLPYNIYIDGVINTYGAAGTYCFTGSCEPVPAFLRCTLRDSNGFKRGQINRYWDNGTHIFSILDLTINGVQYGPGLPLTIVYPGGLIVGIGTDGNTYVTNITDWLNTYLPVGFTLWDDMSVIDRPVGSTFNITIQYDNLTFGNTQIYTYNETSGWTLPNGPHYGDYDCVALGGSSGTGSTVTITDAGGCSATTIVQFSCETPTISISGASPCCVNDGSVTLTINGGVPNYTITGTNLTNTEEIIFTASTSPIYVNHLTEGNWSFNVLDSYGSIFTENITLTASTFSVNFYTASTSLTTGSTFCFSVTSCTTNNTYVSLNNTNLIINQLGTYEGVISSNQVYCFDVPIDQCGQSVTLTISNGINSGTTFYADFRDPCFGLYSDFSVNEGTWVNGYPAYWFTLNSGQRILVYYDLNLGLWAWKNRDTNTICSTSSNLNYWTTLSNTQDCQFGCIDSPSFQLFTYVNNFYYPCNTEDFTVFVPCGTLSLSATSTDPLCTQTCNGTITLTANGGVSPYTFQLRDVNNAILNTVTTSTNPYTFTNLCEGDYYPVVIDSVGTSATTSVVTLVNDFYVNTYVQNIDVTASTGQICVEISGGTNDYDITIQESTPPFTIVVISGHVSDGTYCFTLPFGECYNVIVDDNISLCYEGIYTCIPETPPSCYDLTYTDPTCDCNGTVTVVMSDANPPYTFNLISGSTIVSQVWNDDVYTFTGVCAGDWTVSVTQNNSNITVSCPSGVTLTNTFFADFISATTCQNLGRYCVTVSGGTPPYFIQLGAITPKVSFVDGTFCYEAPCGTYNLSITDSSIPTTCSFSDLITIACGVDLSATTVGNPCLGSGQGSITIGNIGGTSPYQYSINGGLNYYSQNYFPNLNSGTYDLAIKDASGCTATTQVTVGFLPTINVTATTTSENCDHTSGGTINITANGGTLPYTYSFNGGAGTSQTYYTGLTIGTYTINVTDSVGCTTTVTVVIDGPILLSGTTVTSESCQYAPSIVGYRALKVNNVFTFLGNSTEEDKHIQYALCQGFNIFQMYGLYVVFSDGTLSDKLDLFLSKLYAKGLLPVAIMGANTAGFNLVYNWETTPGRVNVFWGVNKENEFWRYPAAGTEDFGPWIGSINYINTVYPGRWHISAYIAYNTANPWGATEADQIISANIDVIECTNFITSYANGRPNPSVNSFLLDDLQKLADAAQRAGVIQDFVPLWNSIGYHDSTNRVPVYQGPYFNLYSGSTPPNLTQPANTYDIDYAATAFANKTYVNKVGYCVFDYNSLISEIPYNSICSASTGTSVSLFSTKGTITINATGGYAPYQYSMDGGSFVTSNYFTDLNSGLHTYVILDASGCTFTGTSQVESALNITTTVTSPNCLSILTGGTICVNITGGYSPYSYSINGGSFVANNCFSGLTIGTYTIGAIDSSGCSATTIVEITAPSPISASTLVINALSCINSNSGSITVTPNGGSAPYNYSINNGLSYQTSNVFGNLSANTYTIYIIDSFGCSGSTQAIVGNSSSFVISASGTSDNCSGSGIGSITINVIGGYSPYQYSTNGGLIFTSPINNSSYYQGGITQGTYDVVVRDSSGCTATTQVVITTNENITLGVTTTPENCSYSSGGTATIGVSGGTPSYTYSLNGGTNVSSNYFTGLTIGTYLVTVTDSLGCSDTITFNINPPLNITGATTPQTCTNNSGGTLTITVSSGNPPYTYSVDGGAFTSVNYFTGLTIGSHTIIVKDSSGCTATTVTQVNPPIIVSAVTTPENCLYTSAGTITIVSTIGGTSPYTYSVNSGSFTNLTYYTGLTVGSYNIIVKDISGCSATTQVTINSPIPVSATVVTTNLSCFGSNNGTLTVTANGGTSPYTYSLNGGTYGSSNYFTNLSAGTYTVNVKDTYGCTANTTGIIASATPITVSAVTTTGITCDDLSFVTLSLIGNGGTPPYTYLWKPINVNVQTINSTDYVTSAGIYSYTGTVIDIFGCSGTSVINFTIISGTTPTLNISSTGMLYCDNSQYVTFSASVIGAYDQIYWNNGEIGVTSITAITPGSYYYYVTIDSCTYTSSAITIDYPQSIPPVIGDSIVLCPCDSTTLSVINNGYTYTDIVWNTSQTGNSITVSSCTEGSFNYYITAIDQYGCPVTSNVVTVQYVQLDVDLFKIDASCPTCADGYAEVQVIGGLGPFIFNWTGTTSNSNIGSNLIPGTYTVEIIDSTGCRALITFEIYGETAQTCVYEPVRNPPLPGEPQGSIVLNPDGTVSFYNPNGLPKVLPLSCVPEECCLQYSTPDLPLQYCNCNCYWREPGCAEQETIDKIIIGTNGSNGVQLLNDPNRDNSLVTCQYQVSFDYLLNFDCEKLFQCVDTNYDGNVLGFLSGLSLNATVEVLSGASYVTKQIVPIWNFNFNNQPTGVYFAGESNYCDILNQLMYTQLGLNCTALTETTFAAVWRTASFKILDSLSGQTIKIGLIMNNFNCEYNILLDKLKIEEVCVIKNEQILSDNSCPGFDLEKVIDNKKSWILNDTKYDRDWYHLKYRDTSYDDYDERLDINTKEVDLNIDSSRAIEYDMYCYAQSNDCFLSNNCNYPNLAIIGRGANINYFSNLSFGGTFSGLVKTFKTSGLTAGEVYDVSFNILSEGPVTGIRYIAIGVITPGVTGEVFIVDNITAATPTGLNTINYTITIPNTQPSYTHFYVRISYWVTSVFGIFPRYSILNDTLSITRHCNTSAIDLSTIIPINSATTFNEFIELVQTQLIDVKNRQTISDYATLRYVLDKYLGLCGTNNCYNDGNQYSYSSLNDFVGLLGDYWMDLVEQFVPATTIWKGGTRTFKNTVFDYSKYEYRNFGLGYCDTEYCFEGNDNEPTYSAACYVASYGGTQLTPAGFSGLSNYIAARIVKSNIDSKIANCAIQNMASCCTLVPSPCFVSAEFGIKFTEGSSTVTASTTTITDINALPTSQDYLNLFYDGLYGLGYSNTYPYNSLEWSKETTSGCADDIIPVPYLTVRFSCTTGFTTSIGSSASTFIYKTLLYTFPSVGRTPQGKPVISGGTIFYGTVRESTTTGVYGYIYSWNINTPGFNVVRAFVSATDDLLNPCSGLVLASDGYLYGTTSYNSNVTNSNFGGLYRINPNNSSSYQELYKFTPTDLSGVLPGQELLLHSDGNIYIPTIGNPTTPQPTTIFKWNTTTQTGSRIYTFNYNTGLIFLTEETSTGLIYGTSSLGGAYNGGTIFRFDRNNPLNTFSILHSFNPTTIAPNDINTPSGPLLYASGGTFYGLTDNGSYGALYRFNSATSAVTTLHTFTNNTTPYEGRNPKGNLILNNNNIFGVTTLNGAIFQYSLTTNQLSVVHVFGSDPILYPADGKNSSQINSYLIYNPTDQWIYGTTPLGGSTSSGEGTIYRFKYTGGTGGSISTSGTAFYECTTFGEYTGVLMTPWSKQLVTFSSSTYVTNTPISGLSCTEYCANYLENPGVEVIVQDLSNTINNPCVDPLILSQCTIIYATHIDNDVWFDGKVTVINTKNPIQGGNNGAVLISNNAGQL